MTNSVEQMKIGVNRILDGRCPHCGKRIMLSDEERSLVDEALEWRKQKKEVLSNEVL